MDALNLRHTKNNKAKHSGIEFIQQHLPHVPEKIAKYHMKSHRKLQL